MFGGFPFGVPTFGDSPLGTAVVLLPPTADVICQALADDATIQLTADDTAIVVPSDDDQMEP